MLAALCAAEVVPEQAVAWAARLLSAVPAQHTVVLATLPVQTSP